MLGRAIAVVAIVAILALGGGYAYDLLISGPDEGNGPVYATEEVVRGDLTVSVEGFGNLEPIWSENIQTDTGGFLEDLTIEQGDEVNEGEVVGHLRNEELAMEVRQMEMELERATSSLAMTLGVPEEGVLDVDPDAGVGIVAPISGRVTELRPEPEEMLESGGMVARIVDDSRVIIDAEFNSAEFDRIQEGQEVDLRPADFSDILAGVIVDANPIPVPRDDHYIHEVTIEAENPGLLRPDQELQVLVEGGIGVDATIDGYYDETSVWSSTEGTVLEVPVDPWEYVEEGEVLCRLGGVETEQFIFDEQMRIRELREALEDKRLEEERLTIRSPIDGTVASVMMGYGGELSPGTHIAAIIDNTKMSLRIELDEIDVIQVEPGMEASVTVDAFPGEAYPATVQNVDMMGSDEEGVTVYGVQLEVEDTGNIRPGMTANVSVFVAEAPDVLLVPMEAIYQEEDRAMVDVYRDGEVEPTPVELGYVSSRYVEVHDGIEEGMRVVTGTSEDVLDHEEVDAPDAPIIPTPEEPDEIEPEPSEPEPAPEPIPEPRPEPEG